MQEWIIDWYVRGPRTFATIPVSDTGEGAKMDLEDQPELRAETSDTAKELAAQHRQQQMIKEQEGYEARRQQDMLQRQKREESRLADRENTMHGSTTTIELGDGSSVGVGSGGPFGPFGHQIRLDVRRGEHDLKLYLTEAQASAIREAISDRGMYVYEFNSRHNR